MPLPTRCDARSGPLRFLRLASASLVALCMAAATAPAWAATSEQAAAQSLFESGTALLKEGRIDEACPMLAESVRLVRSVGGLLNLGRCHELQGKTASAWAEYSESARLARSAGDESRESIARKQADALEAGLSRISVDAAARPAGLRVWLDEIELGLGALGAPMAVDPGPHVVRAEAPGRDPWLASVEVGKDSELTRVSIPPLSETPTPPLPSPAPPPPAPVAPDADDGGLGGQEAAALVLGAVGVAGLVVGAALGAHASSQWSDAQQECTAAPYGCTSNAVALGEDAKLSADISTVGFVAGGAALAAAVVVWLTAPDDEPVGSAVGRARMGQRPAVALRLVPSLEPRAVGLVVQGVLR